VTGVRRVLFRSILQAKIVSTQNWLNKNAIENNLALAEFSVFSQWGDDGIIDFLAQYLDFDHQTFLEFGVENYEEANTRFLLINRNWSGFVIDGSKNHLETIKNSELFWKHELTAACQFITKENINQIKQQINQNIVFKKIIICFLYKILVLIFK
jgi:hypothetical protein